jgi:hypothetical protein
MREAMRGTVVLDARNVLRADAVRAAGLTYVGIGRWPTSTSSRRNWRAPSAPRRA